MRHQLRMALNRHGVWISLLLHLLVLLSFSIVLVPHLPIDEKRPELYVPSYLASPPEVETVATPASAVTPTPPVPQQMAQPETPPPPVEKAVSDTIIEKPIIKPPKVKPPVVIKKTKPVREPLPQPASTAQESMTLSSSAQGVQLIGEKKADRSLRTILGRAISAHLYYPRSAMEYNVKGTVMVGFTLHPDGRMTDVQLVKPSNAGILNAAALSAIQSTSPVFGVEEFVSAPRFLVVGIIFD